MASYRRFYTVHRECERLLDDLIRDPGFELFKAVVGNIGDISNLREQMNYLRQESSYRRRSAEVERLDMESIGGVYDHSIIIKALDFFLEDMKRKP